MTSALCGLCFSVLLADANTPGQVGVTVVAILANHYGILLALVVAAVVSYSVGFMAGLGLFVAAGIIFELAFWIELFKRHRRR